ncbi:MAG: hypothetical protein ACTSRP_20065 [Candidatus Helarchaeota archaeon]
MYNLNFFIEKRSIDVQNKYLGSHINWWNENKIAIMLKKARFNVLYLARYLQSSIAILRNPKLFDKTHPEISFYFKESN